MILKNPEFLYLVGDFAIIYKYPDPLNAEHFIQKRFLIEQFLK